VTEFRLECRDTASCWNIDGELLTTPNIHVKVCTRALAGPLIDGLRWPLLPL
jgi:hypothetical protein